MDFLASIMNSSTEEAISILPSILIIIFGGLISLLGIGHILKGKASSTFTLSSGNKSLKLTKLTQGAVVVIIGALILVVGLCKIPTKKTQITETRTTITHPNGNYETAD